jgi:hypothetical protein
MIINVSKNVTCAEKCCVFFHTHINPAKAHPIKTLKEELTAVSLAMHLTPHLNLPTPANPLAPFTVVVSEV